MGAGVSNVVPTVCFSKQRADFASLQCLQWGTFFLPVDCGKRFASLCFTLMLTIVLRPKLRCWHLLVLTLPCAAPGFCTSYTRQLQRWTWHGRHTSLPTQRQRSTTSSCTTCATFSWSVISERQRKMEEYFFHAANLLIFTSSSSTCLHACCVQEVIKPVLRLPASPTPAEIGARNTALAVLYLCLDVGLRLLHPFMPFITEVKRQGALSITVGSERLKLTQ
jgi:hypothetical protein